MKTGIIVQARMTSTRLPGKVLLPVLGRPLLKYQIDRLKRVKEAEVLIIATTTNATDEPIVRLCQQEGVNVIRGSELDVLDRYYQAASQFGLATVVRVTSDCPLIDPAVIDQGIRMYKNGPRHYDYVSNGRKRTYPRGMDVEVFSMQALAEAYREGKAEPEREHVTPFIYGHPERYVLGELLYDRDESKHRWTVDTPEDFALIEKLLGTLYPVNPQFTLEDLLRVIKEHPEWSEINAHIEQKKLGE